MPPSLPEDLTFHTRFKRRAHGCLPFYMVGAAVLLLPLLWLVPVEKPKPLRPQGVGAVSRVSDMSTDFQVRQHSPLPLLQPRAVDPDFAEEERMSTSRELRMQPAPPIRLFGTPDSAVLDEADLLALPPAEPGKEAAL